MRGGGREDEKLGWYGARTDTCRMQNKTPPPPPPLQGLMMMQFNHLLKSHSCTMYLSAGTVGRTFLSSHKKMINSLFPVQGGRLFHSSHGAAVCMYFINPCKVFLSSSRTGRFRQFYLSSHKQYS